MFKINPTSVQQIYPNNIMKPKASLNPVKFTGASFEPIRPEHFQVRIDDAVVFKQRIDTEPTFRPKDTGFISRMYEKLIKALADNSTENIEPKADALDGYEYKFWYYA